MPHDGERELARLKREKRDIAAGVLPLDAETVLDASIRTFCEDAKATFNASADPDARRAVPRRARRAHHLSQAPGDHRRRSAAAIDGRGRGQEGGVSDRSGDRH